MKFSVQKTVVHNAEWKLVPAFKVVGYSGVGVNFPTESIATMDEVEAQKWCDAVNAGTDLPEAKFASYSDD